MERKLSENVFYLRIDDFIYSSIPLGMVIKKLDEKKMIDFWYFSIKDFLLYSNDFRNMYIEGSSKIYRKIENFKLYQNIQLSSFKRSFYSDKKF